MMMLLLCIDLLRLLLEQLVAVSRRGCAPIARKVAIVFAQLAHHLVQLLLLALRWVHQEVGVQCVQVGGGD